MKITRTNILNGEVNTLDLDITPDQVSTYEAGALLQDAFPQLSVDDREFFKTGITAKSWEMLVT
jgi:hypothetical protein